MSGNESEADKSRRIRNGRMALILSIAWWVISIGGIITVINLQS